MLDGTYRYDQLLTTISVRRTPGKMIAEALFPLVPLDNRSGKIPIFGPENLTPQDDLRAPGTESKLAKTSITDTPYYIGGHSLKDGVPREYQTDVGPTWDLVRSKTLSLTDKVRLNREVALVTLLAAGMTGTSLAAQTATPWNDDANDPIALIKAQIDACQLRGYGRPNLFAPSRPVWTAIQANAYVQGRITGAANLRSALVTPQEFASLIEVDEVLIGEATYNTAIQGQPMVGGWVWGEYALLAVRPATPGPETPALGYHFGWRNALSMLTNGAGVGNGPELVERYWDQKTKQDVVEVHHFVDAKIVAMAAGCLFSDCLA